MSDYISRQAAIEEMCKGCNIEFFDEGCEPRDCEIRNRLQNITAADVRENVKGEWIAQEDDYHHYWECSECGMGVGLDDIRNFCPNCGADMRGEA